MRNKIRITESQMKRIIKESVKKVLKESERQNDYDELGMVRWIDSSRADQEEYDNIEELYKNHRYLDIVNYLLQWDYGEAYGEYYDNVGNYEDIIFEDPDYILVTVNPLRYNGERAFGLYAKIRRGE